MNEPSEDDYETLGAIGDTGEDAAPLAPKVRALKTQLIELGILSKRQWEEGIRDLGSLNNPMAPMTVLNHFREATAPDGLETGRPGPLLTEYQTKQILEGEAEGLRLKHYLILDQIGKGGMGEVFKVRNLHLNRIEAVKTVLFAESTTTSFGSSSPIHARFKREAQVLARLKHPHITTVYDADNHGSIDFITMEYVRGEDLKQLVGDSEEPVPFWWALERIIAVADALRHAHENDIIHRDIKPNNIMIAEGGDVKVLDMGLARLRSVVRPDDDVGDELTQQGTRFGTPTVMPPEQWFDATDVTPATDVYSLGCTFFYVLAGRMPFVAKNTNELMFAHLNDKPPKISKFRPDVPKELDAILEKTLAKKPEDRYATCTELIEALQPLLVFPEDKKRRSRRLALTILGCVAVAALGTIAYPWLFPPWLPRGYKAAENAEINKTSGLYSEIVHAKLGLVFLLIPRTAEVDLDSFYISRDMIDNRTFAAFAQADPDKVVDSVWSKGSLANGEDVGVSNPKLPAFRMTVTEAYECAKWLGGTLPSTREWDKAAGLYDAPQEALGPFFDTGDGQDPEGAIAVNRGNEGPMEIGAATNDRSLYGCRDMAGNGAEWTRSLMAGDEVPIPEPSPDDRVFLRSRSYTRTDPLTFEDLKDREQLDIGSEPYLLEQPDLISPRIGFRVVLPIRD